MGQYAFASVHGGSSFVKALGQCKRGYTTPLNGSKYTQRRRTRSRITSHEKLEPVEDGITLPKPSSAESLVQESEWLAQAITEWLDGEWRQGGAGAIHAEIGRRAGQIYARQRMEGENDLSSMLVAMGSELEGMDFTKAFVGPWNVANKMSELLLEHWIGGGRGGMLEDGYGEEMGDGVVWSRELEKERGREKGGEEEGKWRAAAAVNLGDRFERLKFLKDLLNGEVSKEEASGAVAAALGFRYNERERRWDGSEVSDEHFRKFGDVPPDVVGDEESGEFTETLEYLKGMVARGDEDGKIAEGLEIVMETVHGVEYYRIQRADESDHGFQKRVVVAKWLHLYAGF